MNGKGDKVKILRLTAENFKRLRAVEIVPDPKTNLIQVRGRNGQGKSSVLDAIWAAVGGADAAPSKPVRRGEDKASIRVDLGEIVVTRRFNAANDSSDLRIEAASGARFPSPQRMLDELVGAIAFDPLEFTRQRPRDQLESLRALVKLPIDVAAIDGRNQKDYEQRTQINRDVAALRVRLESFPDEATSSDAAELIDVQAITQRLAQASEHNTLIERRRAGREQLTEKVKNTLVAAEQIETDLPKKMEEVAARALRAVKEVEDQIENLRKQIERLEADATEAVNALHAATAKSAADLRAQATTDQAKLDAAEPLPAEIDALALAQDIDKANTINARITRDRQRTDFKTQLDEAVLESEKLTNQMAARAKEKTDAIAQATFPVPGLAFGDGEVLYNDVPLDQASQAEKIRVGVAVAIAANPKLRVIAVRDGSLLDAESMALLSSLVTDADYQCWVEVTDDDATIGVVIEDGSIVGAMAQSESIVEEVLPISTSVGARQQNDAGR